MRRLSIVNRSEDIVSCHAEQIGKHNAAGPQFVYPTASVTLELSSFRTGLTLRPVSVDEKAGLIDEKSEQSIAPDSFTLRLPLALSAMWKVVEVPESCPWIMYRIKITKEHHRLLILPKREMSNFLGHIPDTVPLSCLTLPGTHDTMAFYGWPMSQCQDVDTPLAVQLESGIRVLDIRLSVKEGRLMAYHSVYPQYATFQEILEVVHAFVTAEKTRSETVVMSVKQEDFRTVPAQLFSDCVRKEIMDGPGGKDMWFLDNRIPTLGEVRGKVVMFSRFGGDGEGWEGGVEGIGIHPTNWPDSEKKGFTWDCKNTLVRTHDWYHIPSFLSIPEKTELSTRILFPPSTDLPTPPLTITFFSAASFPLAFPMTVARGFGWPKWGVGVEGVNSRVARWFMNMLGGDSQDAQGRKEPRIRGWCLMDFYRYPGNALVPLVVECNFRGRVQGEEGWS